MAIADCNEGYCHQEMSKDESGTSGGAPSLDCVTVRTNGSSSKEKCEDSSVESSDGSKERYSWDGIHQTRWGSTQMNVKKPFKH